MTEVKSARIFLSYARKDVGIINDLYDKLKQTGFSPWQDVKDILPGEPWQKMLIRAIQEAPFFLACLSKNYVDKRGMIQVEIKEALEMWRQKLDDDIYFIPVRLEECPVPETLAKFQRVDLFEVNGFNKLLHALRKGMDKLGLTNPLVLRSKPFVNLSHKEVKKMLKNRNFYDKNLNWMGLGIQHVYVQKRIKGVKLIFDYTTGLCWDQSDSSGFDAIDPDGVEKYIFGLNHELFAGYNDWRLPTLEEAMSLMEIKARKGLFINPIFNIQDIIWTSDRIRKKFHEGWVVDFHSGRCGTHGEGEIGDQHFVLVVRSI